MYKVEGLFLLFIFLAVQLKITALEESVMPDYMHGKATVGTTCNYSIYQDLALPMQISFFNNLAIDGTDAKLKWDKWVLSEAVNNSGTRIPQLICNTEEFEGDIRHLQCNSGNNKCECLNLLLPLPLPWHNVTTVLSYLSPVESVCGAPLGEYCDNIKYKCGSGLQCPYKQQKCQWADVDSAGKAKLGKPCNYTLYSQFILIQQRTELGKNGVEFIPDDTYKANWHAEIVKTIKPENHICLNEDAFKGRNTIPLQCGQKSICECLNLPEQNVRTEQPLGTIGCLAVEGSYCNKVLECGFGFRCIKSICSGASLIIPTTTAIVLLELIFISLKYPWHLFYVLSETSRQITLQS